jgi:hypothetical protein
MKLRNLRFQVTLSSVPYFLQAVAVSPPPITVMTPLPVASTTASISFLVPQMAVKQGLLILTLKPIPQVCLLIHEIPIDSGSVFQEIGPNSHFSSLSQLN